MSTTLHIAIAVLLCIACVLGAVAARWLNHVDTEGDDWPGAPEDGGAP